MGGATALRRNPPKPVPPPVSLGNLAIFPEQYRVTIAGRLVPLTYREFELLCLLAANVDRVVRYSDVEEKLWGYQGTDLRRRTSVLVCRLRDKLSAMHPYRIETVRRVGYRLSTPLPPPSRLDDHQA